MWYVEWVDSTTECGTAWHDRKDTKEACATMPEDDMLCRTCGFVLHNDENIVVITQSYHDDEVGVYITIPTVCIKRIEVLKPERP